MDLAKLSAGHPFAIRTISDRPNTSPMALAMLAQYTHEFLHWLAALQAIEFHTVFR